MTREEAVAVLKAFMENPLFSDVHKAAFNIAIHDIKQRHDWDINNLILINKDNYEPLEQEPTTKNDLGVDCISRDVVKNYIQAHIHEIITESGEDKNKHTNRILRSMIHGVNCMPSVTPQLRKGHWKHNKCDVCGASRPPLFDNYCPNCGSYNGGASNGNE